MADMPKIEELDNIPAKTPANAKKYRCINCGNEVKNLFKKYNAGVLKLTECDHCHGIADKYVEYDVVIVIIDLVLLRKVAYRHIILNAEMKNFWKLSVVLLFMEAYSEWSLTYPIRYSKNDDDREKYLDEANLDIAGLQFYKTCLHITLKSFCFLLVLFLLTTLYSTLAKKSSPISFLMVWKTVTVSSFGIFLLLPSLIWDVTLQEIHFCIVALYTILSQLLAYTALCDCYKIWSIMAIFAAYYCKSFIFEFYEIFVDIAKEHCPIRMLTNFVNSNNLLQDH